MPRFDNTKPDSHTEMVHELVRDGYIALATVLELMPQRRAQLKALDSLEVSYLFAMKAVTDYQIERTEKVAEPPPSLL